MKHISAVVRTDIDQLDLLHKRFEILDVGVRTWETAVANRLEFLMDAVVERKKISEQRDDLRKRIQAAYAALRTGGD